jgi:hypothetical protein
MTKPHNQTIMRIATAFIFLLNTLLPWGQKNNFSYEELKEGFYKQYVNKDANATIDSMDVLYWASKISFKKDETEPKYYLCSIPSLHKADDITLPASRFAYLDEYIDSTGNEIHVLYWIEPKQHPHSKENEKLKKSLRKRYGYVTLSDSTTLIPAKWFSGELRFLESPFLYGNQFVSKRLCTVPLTSGAFCPKEKEAPAFSSWWKTGGELEFTIYQLASMQENGWRTPSDMSPQLKSEKALFLFSKEVSRHFDFSLLPDDYRSKKFTVMLRLDETLKAHLYALQPEELSIEDRLILTALSMAVEQQPAASFSGYWCERGLYPAIFLTVSVSKRSGCNFHYFVANE